MYRLLFCTNNFLICTVATVTISDVAVTEPSSDQDVTAATLTLTTSSGGALDVEIIVVVTAMAGTASR